jgi:hypothetical protein
VAETVVSSALGSYRWAVAEQRTRMLAAACANALTADLEVSG